MLVHSTDATNALVHSTKDGSHDETPRPAAVAAGARAGRAMENDVMCGPPEYGDALAQANHIGLARSAYTHRAGPFAIPVD